MKTNPSEHARTSAAYGELRDLIVQGRIAPGTRLIETEVAERLGQSRTPIRSAVRRLEHEGFVITTRRGPRWRSFVAPLTMDDAVELLEIIGAVEGLSARRATEKAPEERRILVERLKAVNERLAALASDPGSDGSRYYDLDQEFHLLYVRAGAGPRLLSLHQAIKPQAERYVRFYVAHRLGQIHESVDEHAAVIEAIDSGDALGAQRTTEGNWTSAAERLASIINTVGEHGSW